MNRDGKNIEAIRKANEVRLTLPRPRCHTILSQAFVIQRTLLTDIIDPTTPKRIRAALARSWCLVNEQIRMIRGIPAPGQLRPDLDPVQLAKALKRQRNRKSIDLPTLDNQAWSETPRDAQLPEETDET